MAEKRKSLIPKTKARIRVFNARRDTLDFRDRMYEPTLVEVPTARDLKEYRKVKVPILDQGREGACTGYGLATVVNYLLRTRHRVPCTTDISPRMLYVLARRYDEWPGENYEGSSARGAIKGWHKHGVCSAALWDAEQEMLSSKVAREAISNPLGAYYRVNHKDLVAIHCAMAEVGILYATASVHEGWEAVGKNGIIRQNDHMLGGHAFAIVAYDQQGFWIQNSWNTSWGKEGFGFLSYEDWLTNGNDIWVARLGVPVMLAESNSSVVRISSSLSRSDALSNHELRRHIVSIGNDGLLKTDGTFGTTAEDVGSIINESGADKILLYAHGGLVDESSAAQVLADLLPQCRQAGVYPISFIWHSDFWTTLRNILKESLGSRRPEGFLDSAKDFLLDRLDDTLEPIARVLGGKAQWDEMKENALGATKETKGGARIAAQCLQQYFNGQNNKEVHVVGHSAGSIFLAPLVQLLVELGLRVKTCTLWAPAITIDLFAKTYQPLIGTDIEQFTLFTMDDKTEQDDNCARIYNKSLLYLVSNAFEESPHIPLFQDGVPLLGMEKFIAANASLTRLFLGDHAEWIKSPNTSADPTSHSTARHHGDFDNDMATVAATLQRISGVVQTQRLSSRNSSWKIREQRRTLDRQ